MSDCLCLSLQDVKLSAEVEPFIPQKKGLEGALVTMSLSGGGEGGGGVEPTPIPSYLITCYPFVQENQPNRQQHPMYSGGGDLRWQQPNPTPGGPYLAYPILSSPQPPVSNDYTYYQIMPAPCPPMMGFYQPFPGTYAGPLQPGVVNPVSADLSERPAPLGQAFGLANQRGGRGMVTPAVLPKSMFYQQQQVGLCQPLRARRPPMRTVAVQKEVCSSGSDGRTKTVLLVDAAQQTDFPGDSACGRVASERASPLLWKNFPRRRRASHPAESSSEADIDSDSGYCSPKHNQQAPGAMQHTAHAAIAPTVGPNSNPVVDPTLYCCLVLWSPTQPAGPGGYATHCPRCYSSYGRPPFNHLLPYSTVNYCKPKHYCSQNTLPLGPIPYPNSIIILKEREGKRGKGCIILKEREGKRGKGCIILKEREGKRGKGCIILKEREGKRGKGCVDQIAASQEEQGEEELHFTDDLTREPASQEGRYRVRGQREEELHFTDDLTREPASQEGRYRVRGQREEELHFTDDLTREPASQEENGLSVPSDDASLSPASQNSPYSITPVSQGSPGSSGIGSPMASNAITKIHSRRFREYCNQVLNKEIDESVTMLLQELVRFQERVYQKDPSKAKTKRRLVMGLREVTKHMKLHKIKCVLISPNCEKIQAKGGLDEALYNVIAMAREQEIPFVFALGRKALGRCVNKLVPVSVVGVFNFSGAEGLFNRLVSLTEDARKSYKDMVSALEQEQAEEALKNVKKVTHHMGHSRNPSAASAISFCSVISEPISEVNEKEYETNWRSMVESSDGLEPVEAKPSHPAASSGFQRDNQPPSTTNRSPYSTTLQLRAAVPAPGSGPGEREEGRADDRLELASQQSTETGSLDGSCRDLLNSSITSTTSTLVPGMLEEAEEEEEEEEEYTPEPISVEVPAVISRIESWVSKTLENLQLGKSQDSTEEEEEEEEEKEEGVQSEEEEELDSADVTETGLEKMEANNITG
eukprot:XP_014031893.1 PREDICTED: selenocysteine insertion sequence-binding protein 2-like [Salmo salar]